MLMGRYKKTLAVNVFKLSPQISLDPDGGSDHVANTDLYGEEINWILHY